MLSLIIALLASIAALAFALAVARTIIAEDEGDDTMRTIATAIQEGAMPFSGENTRSLPALSFL